MEYKLILKELEENYGWNGTKEFTEMQKELVTDVAKIVSSQLEPLVMQKIADGVEDWLKKNDCGYHSNYYCVDEELIPELKKKIESNFSA